MRVLVTGGAGFVAGHLRRELEGAGHEVRLTDVADCDLTDAAAVTALLARERPQAVVHLGAISFVPEAAKDPGLLERVNVGGTRNLLRAMAEVGVPKRPDGLPTFVFVSTAQVESRLLSAYAASKLAAEDEVRRACREGIAAVIVRPANHTGPGQSPKFVVPSFVAQAREIRAGRRARFAVGNLDSVRDFTDVRDVVRAYRLLLERGRAAGVYVVGSNNRMTIRALLEKVAALAGVSAEAAVDPALWRPTDASRVLDTAAVAALGWSAEIPIEATLRDMFLCQSANSVR